MPRSRIRTLQGLAAADPRLDAPADADALTDLWGVGAWTAGYVRMRLGDPDVFLPTDVAILRALARPRPDGGRRATLGARAQLRDAPSLGIPRQP